MSENSPRRIRAAVVLAAAASLVATAVAVQPAAAAPAAAPAPLLPAENGQPNGRYIVVLKPGSAAAGSESPVETARKAGGRDLRRFSRVLNGFAGALSPKALAEVRADPRVAYVRADATVRVDVPPQPGNRAGGGAAQSNVPSWGLDRIDQRALPLNGTYNYDTDGTGVTVWVLDGGIRATHQDFGDRAQAVLNTHGDGRTDDCNGHGTHVAGTIAGTRYGVAKDARIRAVRVTDCNGYGADSFLIEALEYVAAHAQPNSVLNLSQGGYGSEVNAAAERVVDAGVILVNSAGNGGSDACFNNPRSSRGITVGASTRNDVRWITPNWTSNYGTCVDLFAPGDDITSAGTADDTAEAAGWSGTSMAAPHVTGWLARYLEDHPGATPAEAKAALLSATTTGVLTQIGTGSPNRLLYAGSTPGTTDTEVPTVPGIPRVDGLTANTASLSWYPATDNVGVTGYRVELAAGDGSFAPVADTTLSSHTLTGLSANTAYRVRTRAYDAAGNLSVYSFVRSFTTAAGAGVGCTVGYHLSGGGNTFTANLSITNTGTTAINAWSLVFALPSGQSLSQPGWSATYRQSGQTVTATPAAWNGSIGPNQTVSLGFNGTGSGTARPTAFTLNGTACSVA